MAKRSVLFVPLGPLVCKGLPDHFKKASFVYAYVTVTGTVQPSVMFIGIVKFIDTRLVTAQELTLSDLVITKQLFFAGGTT